MFKIKTTSNSQIIKFESHNILTKGSFEFSKDNNDNSSPLASQLLQLPFITNVYISANFVALQKIEMVDWVDVETELKLVIEDYFNQNLPLFKSDKLIPVEVYAESTPNPETMKFVTNKLILKGDIDYNSAESAKDVPFISKLFSFEFVASVFVENNYISVTKIPQADWQESIHILRDYIKSNFEPIERVLKTEETQKSVDITELDKTSKAIISILDEYIKPAVMADGGNIIFDSYDPIDKRVKVILKGACNGCPSSTVTLKNGIEATLKNLLSDKVLCVEAL